MNIGYICSLSDDHWEAAMAMILDYRENGEENREFLAMCAEIAEERLARAEAAKAEEDETWQDETGS